MDSLFPSNGVTLSVFRGKDLMSGRQCSMLRCERTVSDAHSCQFALVRCILGQPCRFRLCSAESSFFQAWSIALPDKCNQPRAQHGLARHPLLGWRGRNRGLMSQKICTKGQPTPTRKYPHPSHLSPMTHGNMFFRLLAAGPDCITPHPAKWLFELF